ncbi:hypothetical protein PIB30_061344 [Stylosanthes scabra]|uniref:Uncharacterized protein n=1 Tax=Stylosanthes scabra TaxID=79078 RepID=A0ABU6ZJJ2_9FABA|nr:hypothetical protein [Stylosanthes scabra]
MSGPQGKRNHLKQERYNAIVNESPKDLNHSKLYKQGASPPQDTHYLTLLTLFDLKPHNPISGLLGLFIFTSIPFYAIVLGYASFGQSLRNLTLTLAPSVGNSYSRDRKHSASDLSGRWKKKSESTTRREAKAVTPN